MEHYTALCVTYYCRITEALVAADDHLLIPGKDGEYVDVFILV